MRQITTGNADESNFHSLDLSVEEATVDCSDRKTPDFSYLGCVKCPLPWLTPLCPIRPVAGPVGRGGGALDPHKVKTSDDHEV